MVAFLAPIYYDPSVSNCTCTLYYNASYAVTGETITATCSDLGIPPPSPPVERAPLPKPRLSRRLESVTPSKVAKLPLRLDLNWTAALKAFR